MKKIPVRFKTTSKFNTEMELKAWCIEQANNWRWDAGTSSYVAGGTPISRIASEPDIIGRAQKIYDWITK